MQADEEWSAHNRYCRLAFSSAIIVQLRQEHKHVPKLIKFPIRLVALLTRFNANMPIRSLNRSSKLTNAVKMSCISDLFFMQLSKMRLNAKAFGMNWNKSLSMWLMLIPFSPESNSLCLMFRIDFQCAKKCSTARTRKRSQRKLMEAKPEHRLAFVDVALILRRRLH